MGVAALTNRVRDRKYLVFVAWALPTNGIQTLVNASDYSPCNLVPYSKSCEDGKHSNLERALVILHDASGSRMGM